MKTLARWIAALLLCWTGCQRYRSDLNYDFAVEQTWIIEDPALQIAQFESVPWRPLDTEPLRERIRENQLVDSRSLLEIGTGTGFFAIVCAREGAKRIVALAGDPASEACARYNIAAEQLDSVIEVRPWAGKQMETADEAGSPDGFSLSDVLGEAERFDFIVMATESPLPEDMYAEVLQELPARLTGGGRCWVICQNEQVEQIVYARGRSLGFVVTNLFPPETPPTPTGGPVYPMTLQIDPFAGAASSSQDDGSPLPVTPSQR